ncbi:MAG: RraA family protein [Betaproteobacteria bacterium]|nr:RraA family protein [Betaproteobacteria bacterium]
MSKTPLGRLPREAIRLLELPRLPKDILDGFSVLVDLTGTISDALDKLGIVGAIPAAELFPVNPGKRLVGPALTVRNVKHSLDIHRAALENASGQGESEAHNLAEPGDVLVIEGIVGCSNMGGQSATTGRRQGEAGAIVDGSIRDPDQYREMGWPVWCRGFTPITGKWRTQTVEVNGTVMIAGVLVKPGDLVCADNAGTCFVPRERAADVLEVARQIDAGDTKRKQDIERGASVGDLMTRQYK